MKGQAKKWIDKAKSDLSAASFTLKGKKYAHAAFWCQQAVEKAFKAVQIEKEGKFDKIHDLVLLAQKIGAPDDIRETCKELTMAYIYARYPDIEMAGKDIKKTAQKFMKDAKKAVEWSEKNL